MIGTDILIKSVDNVIVRNPEIGLVRKAYAEDPIANDNATNVWTDYYDFCSDLDQGNDGERSCCRHFSMSS